MIKRIVKMTFREEEIAGFMANFEAHKAKIKAFPGCNHLELLRATDDSNIFFTFSIWDSPEDLEAYRHSDLFKGIWKVTKLMFDARPQAWSVRHVG